MYFYLVQFKLYAILKVGKFENLLIGGLIMKAQDILKISPKGQVTIPNRVRKQLHLEENGFVSFKITKEGILLFPIEITQKLPYTAEELDKIKKLASKKGKTFKSSSSAKKYLRSL